MILLTHETRILLSVAPADFRNYAPTNFMRFQSFSFLLCH